ncbi:hypothetical protein ACTFIY_012448 [Dictyostelium cf. discoideum]
MAKSISSYNSSLVATGSNFFDTPNDVNIVIDGNQIDKVNLLSIDHDRFEVRYSQKYCKSIYVNIVSGLESNKIKFDFKPLPLKANSVPKSKGGSITITGERLSSQINDELTSCSIDNSQMISCFGYFSNYLNFYENGKINILFSNSIDEIYLPIKSNDFKIDSFSFQLNKKYKTNQVYLNVCNELLPINNIKLNPTIQTTQPTIIYTLQPQLNSSVEQENNKIKPTLIVLVLIKIYQRNKQMKKFQVMDSVEQENKSNKTNTNSYCSNVFSKESLIYVYKTNDLYYSKWNFIDLKYELPFDCIIDSSNRTCTAQMNDEISKKLHGRMETCIVDTDGDVGCIGSSRNYPNPIIEGDFKPPTKGGHTIIKGYYLVIGITFYTIIPNTKVQYVGILNDESFDAINLNLDYKGGCGQRTFEWPSGFQYSFNHIGKISSDNSSLVATGSNFCDTPKDVNIFINGDQIDKVNLLSIDHDRFEVRYSQKYFKSIYVNIVSGGLESNKIKFDFKPLLLKSNSVPKSKGGSITITGERLSSQINDELIIVKIEVTISINGIANVNKLLFSFDVPFISDLILPQGQVKLIGDCLGTNESTQVFINDILQLYLTTNVNDKQTTLSFTPLNQIKKSKLYIIVNGKKSNVFQIDSSFFVKSSPSSPSVLGQLVNFTLYNINLLYHNILPTLTLMDNTTIIGIENSNSKEYSTPTYTFQIPKGCGRDQVSISIENQTTCTEFFCFGNFSNYLNFYENGKINILFSNSFDETYLPIKSIDFKIDSFSFQLNKKYKTNQVYLNVCNELLPINNIKLNSTIQTPQPTIINTLEPQLNSSVEQENKQNKTNTNSNSSNENISKKQTNEKIPSDGYNKKINLIKSIQAVIVQISKESLIYVYKTNDLYYSKWNFIDLKYELPFDCIIDSSNRTCTSQMNYEISKKLHGRIETCIVDTDSDVGCIGSSRNYPNPIIEGDFKPPTKGGHTIIKGYYLVIGIFYLTIIPETLVYPVSSLFNASTDITNLLLDYKGGCGQRTFEWSSGFKFSFNHSNPNIRSISSDNSPLVATGSNFFGTPNNVNIFIYGDQIDKVNLLSIDHDRFEVRYSHKFCKSIYVNIVSGGLESNKIKFDFKPLLLKANSVPKSKGGSITITGERLSSQINNELIIVKIGNFQFKNVVSSQNEITCNLEPVKIGSKDDFIGIDVNLSINSIANDNKLLFSFDVPFISDLILPQGQVKLIGDCLRTNESTQVFINDILQLYLTTNVNDKQTTLSFTPLDQIKKLKLYIIVNGKKSNVFQIDSSFFVKSSPSSPSVLGQLVNFTLYNINLLDHNSLPTLTLMDNTNIIGIDNSNSKEYSTRTYAFPIPKGCGRNQISMSIENQTTRSEFYYELPSVKSCSISSDQMIRCWEILPIIEISLIVCDDISTGIKVDISPSLAPINNFPVFNSTGGQLIINGEIFIPNTSDNTSVNCFSNEQLYNCLYLNYDSISCDIELEGPDDQICQI